MAKGLTLINTIKGSLLEDFYPAGWDLAKIDRLMDAGPEALQTRHKWWHKDFAPVRCDTQADFEVMMGHEIAAAIRKARDADKPLAVIFPVGPMGMYRWAVYFLKHWAVSCRHVHGFNMDEWSDAKGNTMPASNPAAFQNAMQEAFYGPLGRLTVPAKQRHFATRRELPKYSIMIEQVKNKGADLVVIYGAGRACHIAFWEPHFAGEFSSVEEWMVQPHRCGAKTAPADGRAECVPQLQEPQHIGARLRQYDRAGAVPAGRLGDRRLRWRARPGRAVARPAALDDPAARADTVDPQQLHDHAGGPAVLPEGTGWAAVARGPLTSPALRPKRCQVKSW